jgi:predicted PurR-regulated permease PerM
VGVKYYRATFARRPFLGNRFSQKPAILFERESIMEQDGKMQTETSLTKKAVDIAIRLGVLAVLLGWCFQILRPFISPVIWGTIIAVTLLPVFEKINTRLGDRRKVTAAVMTLGSLMVIILPSIQLTVSSVDSLYVLSEKLQGEALRLPPPPEGIGDWPVIGESAEKLWQSTTQNLESTLVKFQPQIVGFAKWLLKNFFGIVAGLFMFAIAIIIAGVLMASAKSGGMMSKRLVVRMAGDHGEEIVGITVQTIRSVVKGIIGVSIIQALLAGLGFAVAGIPAAGLWAFVCLVLAIIQIGIGPVVLLVIIFAFYTMAKTPAVLLTIWLVLVTASDGPMKAVIFGRSASVPMLVIFLGAIGGFIAIGFLGLFIGAVVLSVGYKLFEAWLQDDAAKSSAVNAPERSD